MKTSFVINSILIFVISQFTQSQSSLLDSSKNATTVGIVYTGNSKANSVGAGLAFSFQSKMDIRLSIALATLSNTQLTGFGFSPTFEYLLYKQTKDYPVSLAAGTSFEYISYSDKYQNSEINTSGISLFSTLYHNIHINETVIVQLSYSLRRSWFYLTSRYISDSYLRTISHQYIYYNYYSHNLSLSFVFQTSSKIHYILTPSVLISTNIPIMGVEFVIIL